MQIVGIPCSVSSPGIFGENQAVEALKKYIYEVEKGFILVLNLDTKPLNGSSASGNTLPAIVLSNHYAGWDDYMSSLRTGYRRRLKRLNLPAEELSFEKKHCSAFTPEMYLQYLEVYKRSQGKLEKLSFEFFRQLPAEFMLTLCLRKRRVIGWNIALLNQHRYYFFLGGIDYNLNKTYKTYLSLLSALVKDGIESKADSIDLGQTAEIPKMRMGGQIVPLYMEARHSNFIVNYLLRIFSPLLEYQRKPETSHPVKQEIR